MLKGVRRAGDVIPGFTRKTILHAGPAIAWQDMQPAMQAAITGGLVFEGLAADLNAARERAAGGDIAFGAAHDHQSVGAMAGVITASMPVFVVEEKVTGTQGFAPINEGLGKALRFGANGADVLQRLAWIRDDFAPLLHRALAAHGPLDLAAQIAEALRRGDECHNRNKAATAQFLREIAADLVATGETAERVARAIRFIAGNDHFFLSLSIAHAKAVMLTAERGGIGTMVTAIAGNGREVGIRVSGTGKRWFTAPAEIADVRLFEGHSLDEATPTMGDSYVTEAVGLGAFALAAAPAIAEFIGGRVEDLIARSERMREIAVGEHPLFLIPSLGFRGVPSGIDVLKVVASGITPIVNTGVASRRPGAGQIGAGVQVLPLAPFKAAQGALTGAG
jgi:Protein of unknown function (DUF1116)